jgi:hypothetical protein
MSNRTYKLPDGGTTTDAGKCADTWKEWAKPITSRTGWKLVAFSPDFVFDDNRARGRVTMTPDQVADLGAAFNVEWRAAWQAAREG